MAARLPAVEKGAVRAKLSLHADRRLIVRVGIMLVVSPRKVRSLAVAQTYRHFEEIRRRAEELVRDVDNMSAECIGREFF